MLSSVRVKIASSVKPLNAPDDLVWKRWLKPPSCSSSPFSFDPATIVFHRSFETWIGPALTESCEFSLRRVTILQRKAFDRFLRVQQTKSKHFTLIPPKSHKLFFTISQVKVSEKLYLYSEKRALVFNVFNSKTHSIPSLTTKIELKEYPSSHTAYDTSIQSFIVIENLLPAEFHNVITDKLNSVLFRNISASSNLLPSGHDTGFLNEKYILPFFFGETSVSEELVSMPPATYNVSLLDTAIFKSSTFKLKNLNFDNDSGLHEYPSEKIDLTELTKVLKPASQGFRIKNNGFQGFPANSLEKVSISKNLLNQEFNDYLTPGGNFHGAESHRKTFNLPFLGKDTIQRFPKVKIKSEDPDTIPALAVPLKYDKDFADDQLNGLYDFQNKGVNLLINNSFALLSDESGLGKTVQAVIALQHLAKKRRIKSALIICNRPDTGRKRIASIEGNAEGWIGHLNTWAPELNSIVLSTKNENRKKEWNTPAHVYIVSYECLLHDEAEEVIDHNRLKQFDCIILDNYLSFRLTQYQRDRIFQKLKVRYLWILDNSPVEEFEKNIISYFINLTSNHPVKTANGSEGTIADFTKRRLFRELKCELPQRISRNKWFELNDAQQRDYNAVLEQGQLKLYGSIERGNLFVIRPQIFTILHELMQVLNFSSEGNLSTKAKMLLEEVQKICEHGQKAVIFSQYEKFGLKKLEELFIEHKIKFVTYRAGMNNTALDNVCQSFRSNKDIHVFLADIKAVNKNINLGDFNQIIHFDQWWNPVSLWLAEDKVCSHNNNHVLVQYLRTSNNIEEKIYDKLLAKGLLNKLIVESLSQTAIADIISTEEWFELFELNVNTDDISTEPPADLTGTLAALKESSFENYKSWLSAFLSKAGFTKIKMLNSNNSNNIITLEASKIINTKEEKVLIRSYYNHIVKEEDIIEFLGGISKQKNCSKGLIITNGEFSHGCSKYSAVKIDLLTLIDANLLSRYLTHFKII